MDFALGVLARVTEGQKAAAAAEKRRQAQEAAARRRALEERKQHEQQRIRQDVQRKLARALPKKKIAKRRDATAKAKARRLTPEQIAMKLRGVAPPNPKNSASSASASSAAAAAAKERNRRNVGPPKALPGMDFVERRDKKKEIKVPHTSDYSDLFGDDYLVGIDLKCVKKMKEESAKATKEAQKIIAEQKALKQRRLREAEQVSKISEEMKRRGVKEKQKNQWRLKASEKDWVAVDVPTSALSPSEKAKLKNKASLPSSVSRIGSSSEGASSRLTKAKRAQIDAAEIERKKAALKQSILAATGGAVSAKPKRPRSPSSSPERRPMASRKRQKSLDDERHALKRRSYDDRRSAPRSYGDKRADRRSYDDRHFKKPRYEDRDIGYNSEEWDDDDDDDDEEEVGGIEALDMEEERSARLAAEEDRLERKRELRHRKEKERRRAEFERSRG